MNESTKSAPSKHIAQNAELTETSTGKETRQPLRLAVLGATGSIGRQTLDLVAAHPERFELVTMSVNSRTDEALKAVSKFHPQTLAVCDEHAARGIRDIMKRDFGSTELVTGSDAMTEIATRDDVDMVVTATVGYSGLLPTVAAIKKDKDIALANKETLVVAGDLISELLKTSRTRIYPVDSEHSAIAQCLEGEERDNVHRLIITASGGPFRTLTAKELEQVTAADALRHPNWSMGAKITIDSATMMNKAFEIIEAHHLFGIAPDKINAIVHPQSIIHSMVEFKDGAIKAQLGIPDMHLPIAYALGMHHRIAGASGYLTFEQMHNLTFEQPDTERFPCLTFANTALIRKGNTACIINAANEVAVDAFLHGRIRFTDIFDVVAHTLENIDYESSPRLEDYIETNTLSRRKAEEYINKYKVIN
ncbi:MAG: 1-deoxy-D-xylulose-5-phosphate reductoisomerase [Muribaculaceae bacterium]|nr:1-deoxy-D-xylulose-5-phosphate reductoisomerase [Muribaculaceae bacterium]